MIDNGWSELEASAKKALTETQHLIPDFAQHPDHARGLFWLREMRREGSAVRTFFEKIQACDKFGSLRNGWLQTPGHGILVSANNLVLLFLDGLLNREPILELFQQAAQVADTKSSSSTAFFVLSGVTVKKSLALNQNISIIPWAQVPEVSVKANFNSPFVAGDSGDMLDFHRVFATGAIRVSLPSRGALFESHQEFERLKLSASPMRQEFEVTDLLNCMTSLGYAPVAIIGSWTQLDDPILRTLSGNAFSYSPDIFDHALMAKSHQPSRISPRAFISIHKSWENLTIGERDVLQLSLSRLNQAARRMNSVDRAIDLGIALEVMLLHEQSPEKTELAFRIAVRGAAFLGGNHSNRLKNWRLLKDAYALRSSAAHTGSLKAKVRSKNADEVLSEVSKLIAVIGKRLIQRGRFPDWDTEFVI